MTVNDTDGKHCRSVSCLRIVRNGLGLHRSCYLYSC